MWTSALHAGQEGLQLAGDAAGAFARACEAVDATIHPWRRGLVFGAATVAGFAPFLDAALASAQPAFHAVTWGCTLLFVALLVVLAVARVGSFRDEDTTWKVSVVSQRMAAWGSSLLESVGDWFELDAGRRLLAVLSLVASLSVLFLGGTGVAVVLLDVAAWFSRETSLVDAKEVADYADRLSWLQGVGLASLLASLLGTFFVRRRLAHGAPASALPGGASPALPVLLDCNDTNAVKALAASTPDPTLAALLGALADWKPRPHDNERAYQASLLRFLKSRLPEADPDDEHPLPSPSGKRSLRVDFKVGQVLIEMKYALTTTTLQRAVGQVGMYLDAWKQGPLLLLLCDTDPALANGWLRQEVERLRGRGPISIVLARAGRR